MDDILWDIPDFDSWPKSTEGVFTMRINDDAHIYLSPIDDTHIMAYTVMLDLTDKMLEREWIFSEILSANLFQKGTKIGWFAYDPQMNLVFLCADIPLSNVHSDEFKKAIQDLFSTSTYWQKKLLKKSASKRPKIGFEAMFKI